MLKRMAKALALGVAVLGPVLLLFQSAPAASVRPILPWEFKEVARQGFGDRQNSGTWSMQWWRGKLYVGTVRAWFCWTMAWAHLRYPFMIYPPIGRDFDCAPDPRDLPLQAEIWRYTPETKHWERVHQSPNDVEIPGHPGRYTARDIGYRGMVVFEEPDGTEALYVGAATSYLLWPPVPPPRILRSTDGTTFEPIPQDPGTLLGDLGFEQTSFRSMVVYKGRLYVLNGQIKGSGSVLEAENPAGGNDNFRWITPQDMQVFEMAVFNGFLYLGLADASKGYAVVKTDATGSLPYTFTPVVTDGGFRQPLKSDSVVSMHVFKGRLYVGMDNFGEVIRINPDDTWDLVVGTPRETPDGWKYPLSGMDNGFNWPLNVHMWRMQEHEGVLYVGTGDQSTYWGTTFGMDEQLEWHYGFDLYRTSDGQNFSPITINGFGDMFQMGVRNFASTPYGLFLGTTSFWYGLRVWQGIPGEAYFTYLPLIAKSNGDVVPVTGLSTGPPVVPGLIPDARFITPPERLEVESRDGIVTLSWEPPLGVTRFHILRSDFTTNRQLGIPDLDPDAWVPGPFTEIGATDQFFFSDTTVLPNRPAQYYVQAEDAAGRLSQPSNLVRAPSLAPVVTFESIENLLANWLPELRNKPGEIALELEQVRYDTASADLGNALHRLERLRQTVERAQFTPLEPWQSTDLEILLAKLSRRIRLAQVGVIPLSDLE